LAEGLPTHWEAGTVAWGIALLFLHKFSPRRATQSFPALQAGLGKLMTLWAEKTHPRCDLCINNCAFRQAFSIEDLDLLETLKRLSGLKSVFLRSNSTTRLEAVTLVSKQIRYPIAMRLLKRTGLMALIPLATNRAHRQATPIRIPRPVRNRTLSALANNGCHGLILKQTD